MFSVGLLILAFRHFRLCFLNIFLWIIRLLNLEYLDHFKRNNNIMCKQIAMRWLFCSSCVNKSILLLKKWPVQERRSDRDIRENELKQKVKFRWEPLVIIHSPTKDWDLLCDVTNRVVHVSEFVVGVWDGLMSVRFPGLKFCPSLPLHTHTNLNHTRTHAHTHARTHTASKAHWKFMLLWSGVLSNGTERSQWVILLWHLNWISSKTQADPDKLALMWFPSTLSESAGLGCSWCVWNVRLMNGSC